MEKLLQMRKLSSISTWLEVVSALHNNSESASRLTGWASIQNTRELEEHKLPYYRASWRVLTSIHFSLVEADPTIADKGRLCIVEFRRAITIGVIRYFVIVLCRSSCQNWRGE